MTEYFAYLGGRLINSDGFYCQYGVTAYTMKDAKRILAKAKLYYFGTYRTEGYIRKSN